MQPKLIRVISCTRMILLFICLSSCSEPDKTTIGNRKPDAATIALFNNSKILNTDFKLNSHAPFEIFVSNVLVKHFGEARHRNTSLDFDSEYSKYLNISDSDKPNELKKLAIFCNEDLNAEITLNIYDFYSKNYKHQIQMSSITNYFEWEDLKISALCRLAYTSHHHTGNMGWNYAVLIYCSNLCVEYPEVIERRNYIDLMNSLLINVQYASKDNTLPLFSTLFSIYRANKNNKYSRAYLTYISNVMITNINLVGVYLKYTNGADYQRDHVNSDDGIGGTFPNSQIYNSNVLSNMKFIFSNFCNI